MSHPRFEQVVTCLKKEFPDFELPNIHVQQLPSIDDDPNIPIFYHGDHIEEIFIENDFYIPYYFSPYNILDKDTNFKWIPFHVNWWRIPLYHDVIPLEYNERDIEIFGSYGNNGPDYMTDKYINKTFRELGEKVDSTFDDSEIHIYEIYQKKKLSIIEYYNKLLKSKILFCPAGNGVLSRRFYEGLSKKCLVIATPTSEVDAISNPEPGKHYVEFYSEDEMIDKIKYYKENQGEAEEIANNGYEYWRKWWKPTKDQLNPNLLGLLKEEIEKMVELL